MKIRRLFDSTILHLAHTPRLKVYMCTEIMYENVHYSNAGDRKIFWKPIMFLGIKIGNLILMP